MANKQVSVELVPQVKVTWPDGRSCTFTAEDLAHLIWTLIIEGLLGMAQADQEKILYHMELELVNGPDGALVLRPSGLSNTSRA